MSTLETGQWDVTNLLPLKQAMCQLKLFCHSSPHETHFALNKRPQMRLTVCDQNKIRNMEALTCFNSINALSM